MRPGNSCRIRWLARFLSGRRRPVERIVGRLTCQRVENPALQREARGFGKTEAVLDFDLRSPSPQVAGIGKGRIGDGSERRGRERREEGSVLAGYNRRSFPIQPKAASAKTKQPHGDSVRGVGQAAEKV